MPNHYSHPPPEQVALVYLCLLYSVTWNHMEFRRAALASSLSVVFGESMFS